MYFTIYKQVKLQMKEKFQPQTTSMKCFIYACASTVSEVFTLAFYYPYELIKIRLLTQNEKYKYNGVTDAMKKIYK
jgi:hypothetical protein